MSLIVMSGYFELSKKFRIGRIVCDNGNKTDWFATKFKATESGRWLRDQGLISTQEWQAIEEQIDKSGLPDRNEWLDQFMENINLTSFRNFIEDIKGLIRIAPSADLKEQGEQLLAEFQTLAQEFPS